MSRSSSPGILFLAILLFAGCGHVVYHAPNHPGGGFDFSCPPCSPIRGTDAEGMVTVRYLGAGGLAIGWQGDAVMTAPFFSNYSLARVGLGRLGASTKEIEDGLAGVPLDRVRAILAGHSHYDHLGDLPVVAQDHARGARIYVNRAGFNLLAPDGLGDRLCSLEDHLGEWIWVTGADGARRPIRFLAMPSEHAPHIFRHHWRGGEVKEPLAKKWDGGSMEPVRFVTFLTSRLANEYLARVEESLARGGPAPQGPVGAVCGPSGPEWTMPLPGETLHVQPSGR